MKKIITDLNKKARITVGARLVSAQGHRGITLIALIITVIVLLILAGVALNFIIGENGILKKTEDAIEEYKKSEVLEKLKLKISEVQINKNGNANLQDVINYINEDTEVQISSIDEDVLKTNKIYLFFEGYAFEVDDILNISFIGKENNFRDDVTPPIVEISFQDSNYLFAVKAVINITDDKSGINYKKCKYIFTNSIDEIGTNYNLYTEGNINSTTTIVEKIKSPGDWYLHVIVSDYAGNVIEKVSDTSVLISNTANYSYTGSEEIIDLLSGIYRVECWGASGSSYNATYCGGKGAYTTGIINLPNTLQLIVNVGGNPADKTLIGGFNGGGDGIGPKGNRTNRLWWRWSYRYKVKFFPKQ